MDGGRQGVSVIKLTPTYYNIETTLHIMFNSVAIKRIVKSQNSFARDELVGLGKVSHN